MRSMFSSTTMASSTTMPMASTRPNSVRLLRLYPSSAHDREGSDQGNRHVDHRQDHGPPILKEKQHDEGHQKDGDNQGAKYVIDRFLNKRSGVM